MSYPVDIARLQQIRLFAELEQPLLEQLAAQSQVTQYAINQVVFCEGDKLPPCLYLLMSGRLSITKIAESGKETILRILTSGEIFAAPAMFGDGKAPATATAVEPIAVLTLKREALLNAFSQNPELALQLLVVLNQRLQQLQNRLHGLVSERAIVRLVHYLEYMAAEGGTKIVPEGEQLQLPLTYYQMARSIGITYEECVRLFRQLQSAVTYKRGGIITILDRQQLATMTH